jgi:hypothetical protein
VTEAQDICVSNSNVSPGATTVGALQPVPSYVYTLPLLSTVAQKVVVGHETLVSRVKWFTLTVGPQNMPS